MYWSLVQQDSWKARSAKTGGTVSGEYRGNANNFSACSRALACVFGYPKIASEHKVFMFRTECHRQIANSIVAASLGLVAVTTEYPCAGTQPLVAPCWGCCAFKVVVGRDRFWMHAHDGSISLEELLVYVLYLTVCDLCHLQGNCSNHIVLICNAGSSSRIFADLMVFPEYVNFCNVLQNSSL